MQRLLPIAFRDILPDKIWGPLTELSLFFRDICANALRIEDMEKLEKNIVEILCKLEQIFPPGFFDSMEHLPVHLAYEARVGGPVQYRWMYLFERYMQRLKRKIKNTAAVEGSISEAYIIQEISTFCSFYFESSVHTRLTRLPRNDDGGNVNVVDCLPIFCFPGRGLGSRPPRYLTEDEYHLAQLYVLMNCPEVDPFIQKFDTEVRTQTPNISEEELQDKRSTEFPNWFKTWSSEHIQEIDNKLLELACGPSRLVLCYNRYFVNGYKFHTNEYSTTKKTMNAGVCVKGSTWIDCDCDFYALLEEVLELQYVGCKKIVIFKCHWFDTSSRGSQIHPKYKLVDVNFKSKLASNEPFILASQAQQVYYAKYPGRRRDRSEWRAVCKTKARLRIDPMAEDNDTTRFVLGDFYQEDDPPVVEVVGQTLEDENLVVAQGLAEESVDVEPDDAEDENSCEDEETSEEENDSIDYYSDDIDD